MAEGLAFESQIFQVLFATDAAAVFIDDVTHTTERRAITQRAMEDGAPIILGGELPPDERGRRVGKPDVLVRAEQRLDGRWSYVPVDVKHHRTVEAQTGDAAEATVSSLEEPTVEAARTLPGWSARASEDDLLQLAHYHRMLEGVGFACASPEGGIIGKERHITWHDLSKPRFNARWFAQQKPKESALERYDFEFTFRLDVLAAAAAGAPIVQAVYNSECPTCHWREKCLPELSATDCVSLLPGYGYKEWYIHRSHGVQTRADLAAMDSVAAQLRDAYGRVGDLQKAVEDAEHHLPETPIERIVGLRSKTKIAVLHQHGVRTAADLLGLDRNVVATAKRPVRTLSSVIDQARVATLGGGRPHRRRDAERVLVPHADVEVDIDMENGLDGSVYLWGALEADLYRVFVSWSTPGPAMEAEVFAQFWDWLETRCASAAEAGQSIAFYCWNQTAEATALANGARQAAEHLGRSDDPERVETFLGSGQLVDLMRLFNDQVLTGGGSGLKVIAPLAKFGWRAADAGGDLSMLWHKEATASPDPAVREARRSWLLRYNEDDVRATAAIRSWLRSAEFPSVADLTPT